MNVQFRASFSKDLRNIKNKNLLDRIKGVIENVENAQRLEDISNLKKLKGRNIYYRIRSGEYRIGLIIENNTIVFVRCLNRKEIYRYFPQIVQQPFQPDR
ncbi:MAG: type II toxin-antitoxin system RelE/ParE family toxin [Pseudomonadota bacterium]